eukprot:452706_1
MAVRNKKIVPQLPNAFTNGPQTRSVFFGPNHDHSVALIMGNNSSSAFKELYDAKNFQIQNKKHLEPQLITLPHQRIFNNDEDEKTKVGIDWKTITNILSTMTYNQQSLQSVFKQLASHSGTALIKTLNDDRYSQLKSLFYNKVLAFIVELILKALPIAFPKQKQLYTLPPKSDSKINLTRGQVSVLLACYFFGLFYDKHNKGLNFSYLFSDGGWTDSIAKYHCWIHYFDQVRKRLLINKQKSVEQLQYDFENNYFFNKQYITIYRRYIDLDKVKKLFHPHNLQKNESFLVPINIHSGDKDGIEDCPDSMHMNFANGFIGGKVLTCGSVQEEILFTINTECLVSMLFCRKQMLGNESIIILGTEQFFNYTGYGYSFKYNGLNKNHNDIKQNDDNEFKAKNDRLNTCIIGIDAIAQAGSKQIFMKPMLREMIKSYVGFSCDDNILQHKYSNGIATGNWGCGIFGGDPQLKFMLQWISASLVDINVVNYYVRGNKRLKDVQMIVDLLIKNKKNKICDLWNILSDQSLCDKYQNQKLTLFGFMKTLFGVKEVVNHLHVPSIT